MLGLTCVIFKDLAVSLTALVPPAGHWEPGASVVSYTRSGTAASRLPGRRAAVPSVGGAAGARRPPNSPPSSNALYPDQRCLSGSAAPGPAGETGLISNSKFISKGAGRSSNVVHRGERVKTGRFRLYKLFSFFSFSLNHNMVFKIRGRFKDLRIDITIQTVLKGCRLPVLQTSQISINLHFFHNYIYF